MTTPITTTADRLMELADLVKSAGQDSVILRAEHVTALCSAIKEMAAERDALLSELEAVKADAARYRALRDAGEWIAFDTVWLHEHNLYGQGPDDMDAAIDAAMNDRKEG